MIAHELTHVVQQNGGAVQRSLFNSTQQSEETAESRGMGGEQTEFQAKKPHRLPMQHIQALQPNLIQLTRWKFLGAIFNRRPKNPFPGLSPGSGRLPIPGIPLYKLEHRFSGYEINGSFEAKPNAYSYVLIKYIEKTEQSKGFGQLFKDIEKSAAEVGSRGVTIKIDQCKEAVVDKIEKYGSIGGWKEIEREEGEEGSTGPTIVLQKEVEPLTRSEE